MGKLILILGGARSGKSSYGERLAAEISDDVLFIATAQAWDDDMRQRIERHQADRPADWQTLEAPTGVAAALGDRRARVILLDCITLLASNLLLFDGDDADRDKAASRIAVELDGLLARIEQDEATWIIISNEVGLGLVPDNRLGRIYRDLLGRANQRLAAHAEQVLFLVAGIPMTIKNRQD